jgi:tetratricopeptide (TPR) repeat protein
MKIKVLMAALFGVITISAFAQKRELETAQTEYEKYDGLARANYTLAKPSLINAKTSIDKAVANAKTATLPQTYALQAAIYASIAYKDTVQTTAVTEIATAQEAIKKAKDADTKNEYTKLIQHASLELGQIQLDKGVKAYQNKKFDEAFTAFDAAQKVIPSPDDTLAILYTAISAANSKNYPAAILNYNKLLSSPYKDKAKVYADMPTLYLLSKDTAGAVKIASEAVTKYPTNGDLRKEEIEVSLQAGQQNDLLTKIETAIKADPNNKALYYYAGLTYSQIAEGLQKDIDKLQKADSKAAKAKPGTKIVPNPQIAKLEQSRLDNFTKAADEYKKAVEIDHNYFEAILNLGYVSMAPGIDTYNAARFLNDQKSYDAAMKKANDQFAVAKPYLLKAVELNPKSTDALTNLKSYYLGVKDTDNANATQKKLDALQQNK